MSKSARKKPIGSQTITDSVEVFCRLRPLAKGIEESCVSMFDLRTLQLTSPELPGTDICKQTESKFTQVFCELSSQKEVFEQVGVDLVEDLIVGKDGLLFTYGITGSGKTYTMTGNPKQSGILPRCLDVLFNSIGQYQTGMNVFTPDGYNGFDVQTEAAAAIHRGRMALTNIQKWSTKNDVQLGNNARKNNNENGIEEWELRPRMPDQTKLRCVDEDNAFSVFVSYIEIYNNYIYDLLDQNDDKTKPQSKMLKEDANGIKYVGGVTEVEVKSTEQAFDVFIKGQKFRRTAHTVLNTESSRSHSVFNIRLVQAPLDQSGADVMQDKTKVHCSQLSLVDLAGSERSSRTGNVGDRIKETGHINTSLMTLRQCIEQLRENQKTGSDKMVPYRDSRMTHLFKNYFEGRGKVKMIVCVNPSAADYDENLHVMQFAEMTQEVNIVRANEFKVEGLTPGRRQAAKFQEEFNAAMDELSPIRKIPVTSTGSIYFDGMPRVHFDDPTDDQPAMALRRYFEQKMKRRQEIFVDVDQKFGAYEALIRKFIFDNESSKRRCDEMRQERKELDCENRKIHGQNKQLQHQVTNLTQRLGKYETNAKLKNDEEMSYKRKEREMVAKMRERDMKLEQVRNIFDRGAAANLPTGRTPTKKSNEAIKKVAAISSTRFGGSHESLSTVRTGSTQSSSNNIAGVPPFGANANTNRRAHRAPVVPPKPKLPGHVNTKFHRRSKSATVLDHQPNNKIPPGTYMQPKLRNARVRKNKISSEDLNRANEYVLTHQDTEPNTGALRTSLVKGDVLPTAGGGSAVLFTDIEQLTHNSPAPKRKSSDIDQNTSPKRSRRVV